MKFNHLNVPNHWQNYWTRYPEGHTILEALISWVSQVDSMVDQLNLTTDQIAEIQVHVDSQLDLIMNTVLPENVDNILNTWANNGKLESVLTTNIFSKFAEQNEVDAIQTILQEKAEQTDLTALQAQFNTLVANAGDVTNNAELLNGRVTASGTEQSTLGENIRGTQEGSLLLNKAIKARHLDVLKERPQKNYFNSEAFTMGHYYDWSTGNIKSNGLVGTTDLIPVKKGDYIQFKSDGATSPHLTVWDEHAQYLEGKEFLLADNPGQNVLKYDFNHENTAYMRISIFGTSTYGYMLVKNQAYPSKYVAYDKATYDFTRDIALSEQLEHDNVADYIKLGTVTPSMTNFMKFSGASEEMVNWFNKENVDPNGFYNGSGVYNTQFGTKVQSSEPIPVKPGDVVRFKTDAISSPWINLWDSDYNLIYSREFRRADYPVPTVVEVPIEDNRVKYFVTSVWHTSVEDFMVVKNRAYPGRYFEYGELEGKISFSKNFREGLAEVTTQQTYTKMVGIGDSILFGYDPANSGDKMADPWLTQVGNNIGASNIVNHGISSTTIATKTSDSEWNSARKPMVDRIQTVDTDGDLYILEGGINDFWLGVPLGDMSSRNSDNFYGALHNYYGGMVKRVPSATVVVIGCFDYSGVHPGGVTLEKWVQAQKEVAEYYSIPFFNGLTEAGITPKITEQKNLFIPDGLHFSQLGASRFSKRFTNFIKTV